MGALGGLHAVARLLVDNGHAVEWCSSTSLRVRDLCLQLGLAPDHPPPEVTRPGDLWVTWSGLVRGSPAPGCGLLSYPILPTFLNAAGSLIQRFPTQRFGFLVAESVYPRRLRGVICGATILHHLLGISLVNTSYDLPFTIGSLGSG